MSTSTSVATATTATKKSNVNYYYIAIGIWIFAAVLFIVALTLFTMVKTKNDIDESTRNNYYTAGIVCFILFLVFMAVGSVVANTT